LHCRLDIPGLENRLMLRTHPLDDICVSRQIQRHNIWEPYETSLLVGRLKHGDVFLDIGANIGYYSVLASAIVGEAGMVIAYEPDGANFALLRRNLRLNRAVNVMAFQAALSDYEGSGCLFLSRDNKGDHRLYDSGDDRDCKKVRVLSAGAHLRSLVQRVDFVKIDTQGCEYAVLKGMKEIVLANRGHLTMMVEFWPFGLRLAGAGAEELLDLLAVFGMPLHLIDHYGGRLWPVTLDSLRGWAAETTADPNNNQGFVNLLITSFQEK